jgi:hypothetical protein
MIEVAIGFLGAYLSRKASGLLHRAGTDVDNAIDGKLTELYEFVKGRLLRLGRRGERSLERLEEEPEREVARRDVLEDLGAVLGQDAAGTAQLSALIEDLKQLDPDGVHLQGFAKAETVLPGAHNVGVDVEGPLSAGTTAEGTATATTVEGYQAGVRYRPDQRT